MIDKDALNGTLQTSYFIMTKKERKNIYHFHNHNFNDAVSLGDTGEMIYKERRTRLTMYQKLTEIVSPCP